MIVGKDFGITRKAACESALSWLPSNHKVQFRVADQIQGFHPKAVFWRDMGGQAYAIIGSSNLSLAAFEQNYEANIALPISAEDFDRARRWVDQIADRSVPVSPDWLKAYRESEARGAGRNRREKKSNAAEVLSIQLPKMHGAAAIVKERRTRLDNYRKHREGLHRLLRQCGSREISSTQFYKKLPKYWSYDLEDRLQGRGWERRGKNANFQQISESYLKIIGANDAARDDTVVCEIDRLAEQGNPARKAFLSEMLCLEFPELYPVLNQPIRRFLSEKNFRGALGMSEGASYLDLALRLRLSLD